MAILVKLRGSFSLEMNHIGLDINSLEDVESAKKEVIEEMERISENQDKEGFITLFWEVEKIEVQEGEE